MRENAGGNDTVPISVWCSEDMQPTAMLPTGRCHIT